MGTRGAARAEPGPLPLPYAPERRCSRPLAPRTPPPRGDSGWVRVVASRLGRCGRSLWDPPAGGRAAAAALRSGPASLGEGRVKRARPGGAGGGDPRRPRAGPARASRVPPAGAEGFPRHRPLTCAPSAEHEGLAPPAASSRCRRSGSPAAAGAGSAGCSGRGQAARSRVWGCSGRGPPAPRGLVLLLTCSGHTAKAGHRCATRAPPCPARG